jgi:hypothetical protein
MIEQLFGSKTRVKLLQLFYGNPNRSFYVREITRKIDEQINSVRRELSNLLSIGIISSETTNNKLYYEVNQTYEYYTPLSIIFGPKEPGAAASDKDDKPSAGQTRLKALGRVDLAVMTGKFTRDERSGVDLLIVGDVNSSQVTKYVQELEKKEGRDVRYVTMTAKEFDYRRKIKDRFLANIFDCKKQVLADKDNIFSTVED